MRSIILRTMPYILTLGIAMGNCACTPRTPQTNLTPPIDHKKIMARQKAELADEEAALKKVPEKNGEGYEMSGDQFLSQGKIDKAFKQYFEALQLDPGKDRLRYKMGRLFLEKGLPEEAKKEFQEILKVNPDHALAFEGLGRAYFHMHAYSEAEKNFRQAIQLDPDLWQAHNFLGISYDHQGNYDAAMTEYRAAIALRPKVGSLFNNLGMSLFLKGEYEKAMMAFAEASKIEPSNKRISNNLALALYKLGRYPEALEVFKRAGDEPGAYYNMGSLFMMEGKNREAVIAFEKAIEVKPAFYTRAYEKKKKAQAALNTSQQE